jgi:hypothetical protein
VYDPGAGSFSGSGIRTIHHIPPLFPPGFPLARKVRGKTWFSGGLRRRWLTEGGTILEWDYLRGSIAAYDACGYHVGAFDPVSGALSGDAVSGRWVEP